MTMKSIAFAFLLIFASSCRTQYSSKKTSDEKNLVIDQVDVAKRDTLPTEYVKTANWVTQMQGANGLLRAQKLLILFLYTTMHWHQFGLPLKEKSKIRSEYLITSNRK